MTGPMSVPESVSGQQFAVVWKRAGLRVKRRVFARRASAERWMRLIGPEPWLAFPKKEPDEQHCCDGYMCGCEGKTLRQSLLDARAEFPAMEYARIEVREVSQWSPLVPSSDSSTQKDPIND